MSRGARGELFDHGRFGQFISIGVIGAVIDISISSVLILVAEFPPEIAKLVGAEVAIIVMFMLNDRFTFGEIDTKGVRHAVRRLIKSNVVRSGGLAVQVLVVFVLTRLSVSVYVGDIDVWPVLTMPIAIGCGFLVNYVGETLITWRAHV